MLGQGNIVSQVSAGMWLSLLKCPGVTMVPLHIICVRDKIVPRFMTAIIRSMIHHLKPLQD